MSERTTTGDIKRGFDLLLKMLPALTMIAGLVGAAYVSLYRLGEVEKRIDRVETALEEKASAEDMRGIKRALGNVQLDVAVICSEIVRRRGGDPMRECRTSRGGE